MATTRALIVRYVLPSALVATLGCSHSPNGSKPWTEPSTGHAALAEASRVEVKRPIAMRLLLHPNLVEVREALEAKDDELAAFALRSSMGQGRAFDEHCAECNYLLGVIELRQGAIERATAAFELAAQRDWVLRADAVLHLVELALRRKDCDRANDLLGEMGSGLFDDSAAKEARINVALCQGHKGEAEGLLRAMLKQTAQSSRRARCQILLAQMLLERSAGKRVEHDQDIQQAAELVQGVIEQATTNGTILDRARELLSHIAARDGQRVDAALRRDRTALLDVMVEQRNWAVARQIASELLSQDDSNPLDDESHCKATFAMGRIAAAGGERDAAIDAFERVARRCSDADLAARALYLGAGLQAARQHRTRAISAFAELEHRFPTHRLADDARLKQANLYRAMGSDSRFVSLVDTMPEDFPNGDMVAEGLFQLALKNMTERNWASAILVLERSLRSMQQSGIAKDSEVDRAKYFLAKAQAKSGQLQPALSQLRALIRERPLTYYMLLAYSSLETEQAVGALRDALNESREERKQMSRTGDVGPPKLEHLAALLGVGDVERADELIEDPGDQQIYQTAATAIAEMYAQAGATKTALRLIKRTGQDLRRRWPSDGWIDLWQQAYPQPYRDIVRRESGRTAVPESLIYAIMREESEFDPKAISHADAYGLMQLILPTARIAAKGTGAFVDIRTLLQPKTNIMLGARVLSGLIERFGAQVALVAAGYNAGPGRPAKWLRSFPEMDADLWVEVIEYPETRGYVKRVIESQAAYRWLYEAHSNAAAPIDPLPRQLDASRSR